MIHILDIMFKKVINNSRWYKNYLKKQAAKDKRDFDEFERWCAKQRALNIIPEEVRSIKIPEEIREELSHYNSPGSISDDRYVYHLKFRTKEKRKVGYAWGHGEQETVTEYAYSDPYVVIKKKKYRRHINLDFLTFALIWKGIAAMFIIVILVASIMV